MRPAAMATTYTACPMCEGHGAVRTTESAALVALRKIHNRVALGDVASLRVSLPPRSRSISSTRSATTWRASSSATTARIQVELSDSLMPHQVEIEARQRPAVEKATVRVAPGAAAKVEVSTAPENGVATTGNGSLKKKRRRRGRRKGSGLRAAAAVGEALATLGRTVLSGREDAAPATDAAPAVDAVPTQEADVSAAAQTISAAAPAVAQPSASPGRASSRRRRGGRRRRSAERQAAIPAATGVAAVAPAPSVTIPSTQTPGALSQQPSTAPSPPEPTAVEKPAPTVHTQVAGRDEASMPVDGEVSRRRRAGATSRGRARKSAPVVEATPAGTPQPEVARRRTSRKTAPSTAKEGAGKPTAAAVKSRKTSSSPSRKRAASGATKRKRSAASSTPSEAD